MKEYREIEAWMRANPEASHETLLVESLPSPTFRHEGRMLVSFSTNNYLALATSERLISAAEKGLRKFGVGNCESRLLGGDLEIYREVERKLARMKKKQDAVLYATGYLTNLGVLNALVKSPQICRFYGFRPSTRMKYAYFTDELNHISIREGIRMSEADRVSYRHLDLNHLESSLKRSDAHCKIIVTDGVFSQDGDIAPLPDLMKLADLYDATVYVDDAHGTGVLGANGGGISEHFGCYGERLIHMGTLSKAYGAIGGFVAADAGICEILRLTSSAYGFTSTLPPDQAYAVSEAIEMVQDEPARRANLWANQRKFVSMMQAADFELVSTETPIVPVVIGSETDCDRFAARLRDFGFHVDPVKFPAVAKGKSRLRIILNAHHTDNQIRNLIEAMKIARSELELRTGIETRAMPPTLAALA
ncbi:MAG: pyridoxal phosphate-dependent aminotransferase family protein [Cryobacterium sp.]|nr:pyridoxal phosphate-dependent aminotransferase family protein [Oligoflexia bacterium]